MPKKKSLSEKRQEYQKLRENNFLQYVKKVLGLSKKEYSTLEKNIRLKKLKIFNRLEKLPKGSRVRLKFSPVGESDIQELVSIDIPTQLTLDL